MRKKRRSSSGFTLIELIVAVVLSSIVLMGMFSLLTNMVSAEVNGMRTGTVTAWSLAGITTMNTDIAGAGAIGFPASGGTSNTLIVCTNWSSRPTVPAVVQAGAGNDVYNYCWDDPAVSGDAPPFANAILRSIQHHAGGGEACPTAPMACSQVSYSGGTYGADTLVATGVYKDPANDPVFYADPNTLNAVRLRFVVGNPTNSALSAGGNGGTVTPVSVSVPFNTEIILED